MMSEDDILELGFMLEDKGLTHSEIDDFLEHHGIKGQKWGVRNSRRDLNKTARTARKLREQFYKAKGSADRKAVADKYEKEILNKIKTNDFRQQYRAANTMTKGEMATHILLLGPLAALTIPDMKAQYADKALLGPGVEEKSARIILKEMRRST
jgi:hypothetical protein